MKNHIIAFDDHTNFYPLESELIKISEEKRIFYLVKIRNQLKI